MAVQVTPELGVLSPHSAAVRRCDALPTVCGRHVWQHWQHRCRTRSLTLHYWSVRLARTSTGTSASSAARMLLRLLRVWPADARVPCRSGYPVQDLSASLSPPCRQQRRRLFRLRLGVARRQGRQHAARAGAPMVRATFPLLRVASGSGFESDVWLGLAGRRRRRTMRRQPGSKARLCDGTVLPCL